MEGGISLKQGGLEGDDTKNKEVWREILRRYGGGYFIKTRRFGEGYANTSTAFGFVQFDSIPLTFKTILGH